jgi:hypothetical protein
MRTPASRGCGEEALEPRFESLRIRSVCRPARHGDHFSVEPCSPVLSIGPSTSQSNRSAVARVDPEQVAIECQVVEAAAQGGRFVGRVERRWRVAATWAAYAK